VQSAVEMLYVRALSTALAKICVGLISDLKTVQSKWLSIIRPRNLINLASGNLMPKPNSQLNRNPCLIAGNISLPSAGWSVRLAVICSPLSSG
jgi:hypothetical protein